MYLKIIDDKQFTFLDEMEENNVEISLDDYDKFLVLQNQGKQFKPKKIATGNGLFDYIEEYIPECKYIWKDETKILKEENAQLKLSLAEIAERQEKDKLEMQLAVAELAESLSKGGKS